MDITRFKNLEDDLRKSLTKMSYAQVDYMEHMVVTELWERRMTHGKEVLRFLTEEKEKESNGEERISKEDD